MILKNIPISLFSKMKHSILVDTRGIVDPISAKKEKIIFRGLGRGGFNSTLNASSIVNILTLRYDPSINPNLPKKTWKDFESSNEVPNIFVY